MEAVAWTAIGLLGAAVIGSFGGFFHLGSRIDSPWSAPQRAGGAPRRPHRQSEVRIDRLGELIVAVRALTGRLDAHVERPAG